MSCVYARAYIICGMCVNNNNNNDTVHPVPVHRQEHLILCTSSMCRIIKKDLNKRIGSVLGTRSSSIISP